MPAKKTKRIRSRGGLPPNKYLSDGQVKLLRQYLTRKVNGATLSGPWPVRPFINSMIVDLLLNSGLRAAELCDLQLRDLPGCHGKPIIDVRKGKGRIQRSIFISDALTERLKKFIRLHRRAAKPKSYLFVNELNFGRLSPASLRSKLRIIGDAAGLGRLNPHRFRHTYATHLYKSCQDLLFVSDQLGHKDPETTAIYAKTASDLRQKFANGFGRKKLLRIIEDEKQ